MLNKYNRFLFLLSLGGQSRRAVKLSSPMLRKPADTVALLRRLCCLAGLAQRSKLFHFVGRLLRFPLLTVESRQREMGLRHQRSTFFKIENAFPGSFSERAIAIE